MKRLPYWMLAAAMATASSAATTQPATAPSTAPAASPATGPASQPATAPAEACAAKLMDCCKSSFVIVKIWYKKDVSEPPEPDRQAYDTARLYQEYVDQKRPAEQTGIVIAPGTVLIPDDGLEDRFLDRIEVQTIAGDVLPAKRDKLLLGCPGVLLKVQPPEKLTPIPFRDCTEEAAQELMVARLNKDDERWQVYCASMQASIAFEPGTGKGTFYGFRRAGASKAPLLIADTDGNPLGCIVSSFFDWGQKDIVWRGKDLRDAPAISFDELAKIKAKSEAELTKAVQELVITLHQGPAQGGSRFDDDSEGPCGKEINVYGLAISDTEILVPLALDRKAADQIDKIEIKLSSQKRLSAEFVGVFKDFAAFLVKTTSGKLPGHVATVDKDLEAMKPFWMVTIRKKYGQKHVDLMINRLLARQRGYADRYHWYAVNSMRPMAMLADFQGRLAGLYVPQKREHEEEMALDRGRGDYYATRQSEPRIFLVSEIRDDLANPAAHADSDIKVKPPALAKRRAWLGVEYVSMSPPLAEQMKVETPTNDGRLGLLINAIYPNSPAEKLGLRVGDILLKVQPPGMPYPIDLRGEGDRYGRYGGRYYGRDDAEDDMSGPLERSWKPCGNFLTKALDAVGIGKTVDITYYRPGAAAKTATLKYTVELSPPDNDSAAKWKNRKLGLTVKDLTYEVRYALNLKDNDPGVVLANVEQGSPTEVAKIFPNEILTRLNDQPITSASQMRDLVAKAHKDGRKSVRLTILRLGRTRFADFEIGEYDPKDDEGISK